MTGKSTFMDLRKDEREIRKTLIMEAAMALFEKKSFHEIGMRDIAKEAGVSAATIYRYFPGRDDLFIDALIKDMNNIENLISELPPERQKAFRMSRFEEMKYKEIAEELGISINTLAKWWRGREPSPEHTIKILQLLQEL